MFSSTGKYAIRAVLFLAMDSNESNKLKVDDIATTLDIPKHFLAKILQQLTRSKLISSSKGRNGGFYLSEENRNGNLIEVVEAIDGPLSINDCILGLKHCSDLHPCPYHDQVKSFRSKFITQLNTETIDSILARIDFSKLRIRNLENLNF